ncbi:G-type lectin S-receptor-like serine/threonine-protein kinase LECRK3 [Apium graveolens]|uniref:G-type lectin S-receptor-like serine/threonine-protein kinase LECRK3 n=1 Tax=Apium graveolens TaxID=4045 RepID=UPI003D7C0CD7
MENFSFRLLVLLSATYFVTAQQNATNIISQGSSLTPTGNSSWLSPSGLFAFGFYPQGHNRFGLGIFFNGLAFNKTVVWTANRDNPPVSDDVTLRLNEDGRLILQQQSQDSTTDVVTTDLSISSASMLDTGNFVLYGSNQEKIWQSFDHPTDTILPGQILSKDQELFSSMSNSDYSTGIFRLKMQSDSNLVQYPVQTTDSPQNSYWSTDTYEKGGINVTLNLDPDGHLYLLNNSVAILLNLTSGFSETRKLYLMKIDFDGILRLYSFGLDKRGNKSSIVWISSGDKCDPKGLCGLNGYCILNNNEPKCECPPGFDYVSPSNWTAGCHERVNTADSCKDLEPRNIYNITQMENTWWKSDPYSVLEVKLKDECETACLEDCNCQAAMFTDGECRKQRLPLEYGRKSLTESNIAYIKWASSTPEIEAPADRKTEKKSEGHLRMLLIIVSLVAFAFMVLVIFGLFAYNRSWKFKKILVNGNFELMEDIAPRSFTFAELEKVTNGFHEEIGRGSSGTVYRGTLNLTNQVVAVKRLVNMLEEGEKEFQNEMKVIGRTHHRNLVRLLGYCNDGPQKLLVYEYMVNGSLANILFDAQHPPRWDERIRIALEIARGILYLHEECATQIIHCDIKPQNILIDEYMSAKISDFGLAKLLQADQTNTNTGIRGTRGYVAPEWHRKMAVTAKVDVYSFGIMLLEILCCRKNIVLDLSEEEAVLEDWVYQCFENNELAKLVTGEEIDMITFERMVRVGLWCVLDEPSIRPSMKKVLLMLEGTVDIPAPPVLRTYLTAI